MMLFVETLLKTLKELFRHRGRLAILVLSPIIFFGFFGFVFGPSAPQDFTTYIGYLNEDTGVYSGDLPASLGVDSGDNLAQTYLEILDENTEVLVDTKYTVVLYEYETEAEMVKDLERLSINAGIILPDDFTEAVEVARERLLTQQGVLINTTVKILGDPSTQSYQAASGVLEQSMTAYLEAFYGIEVLLGEPPQGGYLSMVTSDISAEQESPFEYFIAGFLVFNVILQMMSVAGLIATEREQQTLDRMKMSYIKPWELFSGLLVAQLIAYTLQFVISYLVISFFGFEATGAQWLLAYVVLLISTVFIVGLS
ncbi:MAG: ABC transporter permease, partial [Candidatus Kariarchaeaceae archaeon]